MKQYLNICIAIAAVIALTSCGDNKVSQKLIGTSAVTASNIGNGTGSGAGGGIITGSFTEAQEIAFAEQVFASAMDAYRQKSGGTVGSSAQYYAHYNYAGPVGGDMPIQGNFLGTYNGSIYTLAIYLNEYLNNFSFQYNGVTYAMNNFQNNNPLIVSLTITGTLYTPDPNGTTFVSPSDVIMTGNYIITGGGIVQTIALNVKVTLNSTGTGGTMTGTSGVYTVNQAFTL